MTNSAQPLKRYGLFHGANGEMPHLGLKDNGPWIAYVEHLSEMAKAQAERDVLDELCESRLREIHELYEQVRVAMEWIGRHASGDSATDGYVSVPREPTYEQFLAFANATGLAIEDACEEYSHLIEVFYTTPEKTP